MNRFNIYPNPSKGVFTLFTNDYPPGQYTLSIYSSMNKLVKQSTISLERNQQLQFDYSDLPSGFYILSVGANSQVHAEKLIIAK